MDALIPGEKIETLRRCVQRVEERRTATADELRNDADRQDILSLNLTRAVQLCVDIATHALVETDQPSPQSMGESFDLLAAEGMISADLAARLRSAVGFRNVAVHSYQTINWAVVHHIAHEGLDDFRAFARAMDGLIDEE